MNFFYITIFFDSDNEYAVGDLKLWNGNKDISTYICAWKQKDTDMHNDYWVQNNIMILNIRNEGQ